MAASTTPAIANADGAAAAIVGPVIAESSNYGRVRSRGVRSRSIRRRSIRSRGALGWRLASGTCG